MDGFEREVDSGQRFEFGKNWRAFLDNLDEDRVAIAEASLQEMLGLERLDGLRFLDVGSGSGLFSLVARRLGARVHSFDFDPASVACAEALRARFFADDPGWKIERGSVLDRDYLSQLGLHDVVYAWGVLHHTGDMWTALANAAELVDKGGLLFVAIYNDQGLRSRLWWRVKKAYCSGRLGKAAVSSATIPYFFARTLAKSALSRRNAFADYRHSRGMSIVRDWFDWIGGFPFEVASAEAVFEFFSARGFVLKNLKTTNGLGNNELVMQRR